MSTYFTDVNIPIKLYNMDVDIPNNNETEGISTYHRDVNIHHKWTMISINSTYWGNIHITKLILLNNKCLDDFKIKSLINAS